MPVFEVQLAEIRRLAAYVDAKTPAAAKREVRQAWAKISKKISLPFEVRIARLYRPSLEARPVWLKTTQNRSKRTGKGRQRR